MRPFATIFVDGDLQDAVSDGAWLAALLEAERALAAAEADAGVIPADAAASIAAACGPVGFDAATLAARARAAGNPVEPLVRALREAVGGEAARYVHWGATSQDAMDTAAMLVCRDALGLVIDRLDSLTGACARLARDHRATPMAGRTLLQQAVPVTFGLEAAGWLAGALRARRRLVELREHGLAAELGGAAGTLAVLGEHGERVLARYAQELGLPAPVLPWHTERTRVAEIGAALAVAAGAVEKAAQDVLLLAQTEVGEVAEPAGGRSSTMPHKRNPIRSTLAVACARDARAQAALLVDSMAQQHQRGAGGWHTEWAALSAALALTGAAAGHLAGALDGLEVREERMRANLEATGGLVMAERVAFLLAPRLAGGEAHDVLADAAARAARNATTLRDELLADERVEADEQELDAALDPAGYLGSAKRFVERVLERYAAEVAPP